MSDIFLPASARNGNMKIAFQNYLDTATLTNILGSTSVEFLKNVSRGEVFKFAKTSPYKIFKGTWATKRDVDVIFFHRHNLSKDGSFRAVFFSGANQTGDVVWDTARFPAWPWVENSGDFDDAWDRFYSVRFAPIPAYAQSFEIYAEDPDNPLTLEVCRVFIGNTFVPSYNADYGAELIINDDSRQVVMEDGSIFTHRKVNWRELAISFGWIDESEAGTFMSGFRRAGKKTDIFVSVFPEAYNERERDFTFLGKLKTVPGTPHIFWKTWATKIDLREI